jgi:hypothetical protein
VRRKSVVNFKAIAEAALQQEQERLAAEHIQKLYDARENIKDETEADSAERRQKIEERAAKASTAYANNLANKKEKEDATAEMLREKDNKNEVRV